LVANIFQIALEEDIAEFYDEVLKQINNLVPFDGASWLIYFKKSDRSFYTHIQRSSQNHNEHSIFNSSRLPGSCDNGQQSNHSETVNTYAVGRSKFADQLLNETDNVNHRIILHREKTQVTFQLTELEILENLAPLIWQAYILCLDCQIGKNWRFKKSYTAISTSEFELVNSQAGFIQQMDELVPHWNKYKIPNKFKLRSGNNVKSYKDYELKTLPVGEMLRLELYYVDPLIKLLTKKQFQISALLIKSFSNKSIATQQHLSLKTVERHLKETYLKLQVSNRTEAIWYLSHSNINWNRY
jgi:DNA-binding CsgD family transcriptional regulator